MAINAYLNPLTLPANTEWPGTPQLGLAMTAQYMEILGLEDLGGVVRGSTTPASEDRDKAWLKTDVSGNPLGWYSWNGSAWSQILFSAPSGTTANRPGSAVAGQFYYDTTIGVLLMYNGSAWVTAAGSPGDIKFVSAASESEATTKNPGWTILSAADGRVLAAATGATGKDNGDTTGAEEVTLTAEQLPAHAHEVTSPYGSESDNGDEGPYIVTSEDQPTPSKAFNGTSSSVGDGDPVRVMQPTIYYWCLIKS